MLNTCLNMIGATSSRPSEPITKPGVERTPTLTLCTIPDRLDIKKCKSFFKQSTVILLKYKKKIVNQILTMRNFYKS